MPTILQLCQRAILMEGGRLTREGTPGEVVDLYHRDDQDGEDEVRDLEDLERGELQHGGARLLACRLTTPDRVGPWQIPFGSRVSLEITAAVERQLSALEFGLALQTSVGLEVASPLSSDVGPRLTLDPGEYAFSVGLPTLKLKPGRYKLGFGLRSDRGMVDLIPEAVSFEVLPNRESSEALMHHRSGAVIPDFNFSISPLRASHGARTPDTAAVAR
jgi:lipopolysaccharide transport system ATP-binding protein